jgi:hypothetical protein
MTSLAISAFLTEASIQQADVREITQAQGLIGLASSHRLLSLYIQQVALSRQIGQRELSRVTLKPMALYMPPSPTAVMNRATPKEAMNVLIDLLHATSTGDYY